MTRFECHIDFGHFGIERIAPLDGRDNRLDDIPKINNFGSVSTRTARESEKATNLISISFLSKVSKRI